MWRMMGAVFGWKLMGIQHNDCIIIVKERRIRTLKPAVPACPTWDVGDRRSRNALARDLIPKAWITDYSLLFLTLSYQINIVIDFLVSSSNFIDLRVHPHLVADHSFMIQLAWRGLGPTLESSFGRPTTHGTSTYS